MKETGSPKMMTSPQEQVAEAPERRSGERREHQVTKKLPRTEKSLGIALIA